MKNNLILSKYITEGVQGTKSVYDNRTFFGSKMVDIEDLIFVDNSVIQYTEVYDEIDKRNNGYQYYEDIYNIEKDYLVMLDDIKSLNQNITLLSQHDIDLNINTNWLIVINWKVILEEYLYYRLKEARTFKVIKYSDTIKENINIYIRDYIQQNLINRYDFDYIDLYVEYVELDQYDKEKDVNLSYNPIFDISVRKEGNKIVNANLTKFSELLNINYKQTESSKSYTFKYYFDLYFKRV